MADIPLYVFEEGEPLARLAVCTSTRDSWDALLYCEVVLAVFGVHITPRWLPGLPDHLGTDEAYANFLADAGEQPAGTRLERIDATGDYAPGNVEWR